MSITGQDASAPPGGAPRRRMPRAEREALMLDVAEQIFGELGYQASSMDEIAARAGVSKPMLYHYYGSKERLFLACLRRARDGMRGAILAGVGAGARPDEQLYLALVGWYRFIDSRPALWTMIVDEGLLEFGPGSDEIESIRAEHTELIAALIMSHAPPGHTDDMIEVELIAAAISGAGERITRWRSRHPELTPEQTARHLMQLIWIGLAGMAQGAVWDP
ncbi:MAG TPA: TetR/AcrR family transcriptional regulator [Sporichthya sp.]|nr:TetR/AcrR family transcriptional regulator [Sporichthya sp.]